MNLRDLSDENNDGQPAGANVIAITETSAGVPIDPAVETGEPPVMFSKEVTGLAPKIEGSLVTINENVTKITDIKDIEASILGSNGASKETVVAVEALTPGLITDKYPLGYFTVKPTTVHFDEVKKIMAKKIVAMEEEVIQQVATISSTYMKELLANAKYRVERFVYQEKNTLARNYNDDNLVDRFLKVSSIVEVNGEFVNTMELTGMGSAVNFNNPDWIKLRNYCANTSNDTNVIYGTELALEKIKYIFAITKLKQILDIPEVAKFYSNVLNHATVSTTGVAIFDTKELPSDLVLSNMSVRNFIKMTASTSFLEDVEKYVTSFKDNCLESTLVDFTSKNIDEAVTLSGTYASVLEQVKIIDAGLSAVFVNTQNTINKIIDLSI